MFLYGNVLPARGQNISETPSTFNNYIRNIGFIQPPGFQFDHDYEFTTNYQALTGIFSEVKNIYINVAIRAKDRHHFGLILRGENESEFFKRSRVYGQYAVQIPITNTWRLRGGVALGWVNYHFPDSQASKGGSGGAVDGTLGIGLSSEKTYFGISINQFPNQSFSPITYSYVLERYYEFIGSHKIAIDPKNSFNINARSRISPKTIHAYFASLNWEYRETLLIGLGTRNLKGLSGSIGVIIPYKPSQKAELLFLYYQPVGSSKSLNVSNFEILLKLALDKE